MTNYLCLIGTLFISFCFFAEVAVASPSSNWSHDAIPPGAVLSGRNQHFLSLRVAEVQEKVLISWEAAQPAQVSYYLVERRSLTGKYLAIGGINVGNRMSSAHQSFIDQMPRHQDGAFIYRIKQVLKSGEVHYSPEQALYQKPQQVRVFPDLQNQLLELQFDQVAPAPYQVELMNLQGQILELHKVGVNESPLGSFRLPISHLQRGIYLVRISTKNYTKTQRILIH